MTLRRVYKLVTRRHFEDDSKELIVMKAKSAFKLFKEYMQCTDDITKCTEDRLQLITRPQQRELNDLLIPTEPASSPDNEYYSVHANDLENLMTDLIARKKHQFQKNQKKKKSKTEQKTTEEKVQQATDEEATEEQDAGQLTRQEFVSAYTQRILDGSGTETKANEFYDRLAGSPDIHTISILKPFNSDNMDKALHPFLLYTKGGYEPEEGENEDSTMKTPQGYETVPKRWSGGYGDEQGYEDAEKYKAQQSEADNVEVEEQREGEEEREYEGEEEDGKEEGGEEEEGQRRDDDEDEDSREPEEEAANIKEEL